MQTITRMSPGSAPIYESERQAKKNVCVEVLAILKEQAKGSSHP
jgi:hypothetical protein